MEALALRLLGAKLAKPDQLRFGKWSTLPLPADMQTYAATDAAAGRDILCKLQQLRGMPSALAVQTLSSVPLYACHEMSGFHAFK
jgi:hypothetical protein